ncbi:MAG TPA: LCP family protein, partial [Mycobacteriales bacterium]|nr:LCP family protein [Mycobacteriales bacterium]
MADGPSRPRLRRVLVWLSASLAVVLVVAAVGGYLVYRHLNGNIAHKKIEVIGERPSPGLGESKNILVMGSDTRDFKGGRKFGGEIAGARSDTTIVVHIAADGEHAVLVSIPRDTYTRIPRCKTATGVSDPQWNKFNVAFSIGGPSCTIATVEHLTKLRIDHYVEVNFAGFKSMVDALGGVNVCISHAINDPIVQDASGGYHGSGLVIDAGNHTLRGDQALAFVRARYGVGDGSDLGRIKNQQVFLSSMIRKATSKGLLFHPLSLYRFLNAATKSIETDPGFGLTQLKDLAGKLHGLRPGKVALLTVPLSDPNAYVDIGGVQASVVFWDKERAHALWTALKEDRPLPGTEPRPKPSGTASPTTRLIVAPSAIHVRVLNGTGESGLAARVADDLRARGFVVDEVGDADSTGYGESVVRYGTEKRESSETLAASVPGSTRQQDATLGSVLELIVGSD